MLSAFDNDTAGGLLDGKLRAIWPAAERLAPPSRVEGATGICKDWLNVLIAPKSVGTDPRRMDPECVPLEREPEPEDVDEDPPEQPFPSTDEGPSFW